MITQRQSVRFSGAGAMVLLLLAAVTASGAEELKNPRLQRSLQSLEVARAHFDAASRQSAPELRDGAHDVIGHIDGAIRELNETLTAFGTRRQIEPGRVEPSDRPIHTGRDKLHQALDELTNGVKDDDIKGRIRVAYEQINAALDRAERLTRREDAMPPLRPVAEVRLPRLQQAIQSLEVARQHLDAVQQRGPRDVREDARQASLDVDAALREALDSLASAGIPRTVEPGRADPSDRPLHAAREALGRADDLLANVAGGEFHGHERRAQERTRLAIQDLDRLVRRE